MTYPHPWKPWKHYEEARLQRMIAAGHNYRQIAAHMGRSYFSIKFKAVVMRTRQARMETYSASDVALMLGFSHHSTVVRWIHVGWLPAQTARTANNQAWKIQKADLYTFLQNDHYWMLWTPERIAPKEMRAWALEMRAPKPRWLTTAELARRYHVAIITANVWCQRGILPSLWRGRYYVRESDLHGFVPPCMRGKR